MTDFNSFSHALSQVKLGLAYRRRAWKTNKVLVLQPQDGLYLAHLALLYDDGRQIPWIPVQCDMLENDWEVAYGFGG